MRHVTALHERGLYGQFLAKMQCVYDLKGNPMARSSVWLRLFATALAAVNLSGCAKLEDRARYYLASSVDVFAVVDGKLMQGKAALYSDRTGTIAISTGLTVAPAVSCSGRMRRTGTASALLDVYCNDGTELSMSAVMLAETQAYAYGQTANNKAASLTLGLDPARAVSYLRAPAGQELVTVPKKPFMVLR